MEAQAARGGSGLGPLIIEFSAPSIKAPGWGSGPRVIESITPPARPSAGPTVFLNAGSTVYARQRETVIIPSGTEGKVRLYGGSYGRVLMVAERLGEVHPNPTGRINVLYGSQLEMEEGAMFPGHIVVSGRPRFRKRQGLMACKAHASGELILHGGRVADMMATLTLREGARVELLPGFSDLDFVLPFATKGVFHENSLGQCGPGSVGFAKNGSCVLVHENTVILAEPDAILKQPLPLPADYRCDPRAPGIGLEIQDGDVHYVLGPGVYTVERILLRGEKCHSTGGTRTRDLKKSVVCPWRATVMFTADQKMMTSHRRRTRHRDGHRTSGGGLQPVPTAADPETADPLCALPARRLETETNIEQDDAAGQDQPPRSHAAAVDRCIHEAYEQPRVRVVLPTDELGQEVSRQPRPTISAEGNPNDITLFVPANEATFRVPGEGDTPVCWGVIVRVDGSQVIQALLTEEGFGVPVDALVGFVPG